MKERTKEKIQRGREILETFGQLGGLAAGGLWVVNILTGKGAGNEAPEWAKAADQLYHGSKKDPIDEIAMIAIRGKLEEQHSGDLKWWDGYMERNMTRYGDTRLGHAAFKKYNYELRQYIVTMRTVVPSPKTIVTTTEGNEKEVTKLPTPVEIDYTAPVALLHEVVEKMKDAYNASDATTAEGKKETAHLCADHFLRQQGFPMPHFNNPLIDIGESLLEEVESLSSERFVDNLRRGRDKGKALFS